MPEQLRISVSWLDSYEYWLKSEGVTEQEFIDDLFGFTGNPATRAGTAWHSVLEHASEGLDLSQPIELDGHKFSLIDDLEGDIELGHMRELKYTVPVLPDVTLVGKLDAETIDTVIDHKLTARIDVDRYMDSMQWRAYLMMRGKPKFKYQLFRHTGLNQNGSTTEIKVVEYLELSMAAYSGMADDVIECVNGLANILWRNYPAYLDYRARRDAEFKQTQNISDAIDLDRHENLWGRA